MAFPESGFPHFRRSSSPDPLPLSRSHIFVFSRQLQPIRASIRRSRPYLGFTSSKPGLLSQSKRRPGQQRAAACYSASLALRCGVSFCAPRLVFLVCTSFLGSDPSFAIARSVFRHRLLCLRCLRWRKKQCSCAEDFCSPPKAQFFLHRRPRACVPKRPCPPRAVPCTARSRQAPGAGLGAAGKRMGILRAHGRFCALRICLSLAIAASGRRGEGRPLRHR